VGQLVLQVLLELQAILVQQVTQVLVDKKEPPVQLVQQEKHQIQEQQVIQVQEV
jgi:hypothetical protein